MGNSQNKSVKQQQHIEQLLDEFVIIHNDDNNNKYLIVLDIDGTLVHRIFNRKKRKIRHNPSFTIRDRLYNVYKRPFMNDFLEYLHNHGYYIALWGDAVKWNVDSLTDQLCPITSPIHPEFVWSIDQMTPTNNLKSINTIMEFSKNKWNYTNTIIIDDNIEKIDKDSRKNTIIIPRYYNQHVNWDCSLLLLKNFFEKINGNNIDAREIVQLYNKKSN